MAAKTKQIWIQGKRQCLACLTVTDYGESIVVSAEDDKVAFDQLMKGVEQDYPGYVFKSLPIGKGYIGVTGRLS